MAIVKMKRLRLVGLRSDQEALLRQLQRLGCVEISQRSDGQVPEALSPPDGAALNEARGSAAELQTALGTLRKYVKGKGGLLEPRPVVSRQELFDDGACAEGLACARQINEAARQIAALQAERGKLEGQRQLLVPWLPLDISLDAQDTRETRVRFGAIPARFPLEEVISAVAGASELAQLLPGASDSDAHHLLLICHKSAWEAVSAALKEFSWSAVNMKDWSGTAKENDRALEGRLAQLARELEGAQASITALGEKQGGLERTLDRVDQDISREEAKSRLLDSDQAFFLDGWFPAGQEGELKKLLSGFVCAWESADPTEEEYPQVPVKLKNNRVTRSMNTITEMYSLPAYDGIDANPLMAPFFIVIFGLMMADMAYGLLIVLGTGIYLKKARPRDPYFMEMFFWCGISTFIVGALTGGFFGDFIPQLLGMMGIQFTMPALFSPMDDTLAIMVGSVVLGFVQIITGMAVSVVHKTKKGDFLDALFDEISWWIILAGLAVWLCGSMFALLPPALGTVGLVMLIAGGLMLALGGTRKAKGFGKLTSLVGILYNGVTGFFSDALSYVRIMALMLSGSVIASVFNTLGATTGLVPVYIVISLLGNVLNFALCVLGAYVHDLRLQCLEFFGRFYEEGGKPYRPLSVDTKYVEIIKEEN